MPENAFNSATLFGSGKFIITSTFARETIFAVIEYSRYVTSVTKNEHLPFFKQRLKFFITSKVVCKFFNKSYGLPLQ